MRSATPGVAPSLFARRGFLDSFVGSAALDDFTARKGMGRAISSLQHSTLSTALAQWKDRPKSNGIRLGFVAVRICYRTSYPLKIRSGDGTVSLISRSDRLRYYSGVRELPLWHTCQGCQRPRASARLFWCRNGTGGPDKACLPSVTHAHLHRGQRKHSLTGGTALRAIAHGRLHTDKHAWDGFVL